MRIFLAFLPAPSASHQRIVLRVVEIDETVVCRPRRGVRAATRKFRGVPPDHGISIFCPGMTLNHTLAESPKNPVQRRMDTGFVAASSL